MSVPEEVAAEGKEHWDEESSNDELEDIEPDDEVDNDPSDFTVAPHHFIYLKKLRQNLSVRPGQHANQHKNAVAKVISVKPKPKPKPKPQHMEDNSEKDESPAPVYDSRGTRLMVCEHSTIPTFCRLCGGPRETTQRRLSHEIHFDRSANGPSVEKPTIPAPVGSCKHKRDRNCLLTTPQCCECSDMREHRERYEIYVDGVGDVETAYRHSFYCQTCFDYAEIKRHATEKAEFLKLQAKLAESRVKRQANFPGIPANMAAQKQVRTDRPMIKVFFFPYSKPMPGAPRASLMRVPGATRDSGSRFSPLEQPPTIRPTLAADHQGREKSAETVDDHDDCTVITLDATNLSGYVSHMSASSWSHLADPSRDPASVFRLQEAVSAISTANSAELRTCGHRCEVRFRDDGACCECADSRDESDTYYIWAVKGVEECDGGDDDWDKLDDEFSDARDGVLVETSDRKALYCGSCRSR
ncbi:hypothetical protein BJ742DRAFT_773356 [Cladochytrium replicatum]|nr:hypothetical protein BJ742DRAFT_773356 [Cladochytrium replicatum]